MTWFTLDTDTFIAPKLYPAGSRINYEGPLGPHFKPEDDEGEALMVAYYKANPQASINPVADLAGTVDGPIATVHSSLPPAAPTQDNGIDGLAEALTKPPVLQEQGIHTKPATPPVVKPNDPDAVDLPSGKAATDPKPA